MPGTRSSARLSATGSSPPATGSKRKADEADPSPAAAKSKRGRPSETEPKQQTIEQSLQGPSDYKTEDDGAPGQPSNDIEHDPKKEGENAFDKVKADDSHAKPSGNDGSGNADDQEKQDPQQQSTEDRTMVAEENKQSTQDHTPAVEEGKKREKAQPSNVLEKGIIYFFTRGRVNVDDPNGIQDLARSYFVLRPLPAGAKLTDGAIQDLGSNRLFELPKKVFPKSHNDRFMAFVSKAKTTIQDLKENFFYGNEYSTQTQGTRYTPSVDPVGEGVYVMVKTGGGRGTSHLVYMLTIPSKPAELQKDLGIAQKGSFIMSIKNPKSTGPANAQLPQSADFPKEFLDEFAGRAWGPAEPKHLDYANAQILLIGEDFESSHNLEADPKDEGSKQETPQEEREKLEEEDEHRVERLAGDDSIFADLDISSQELSSKGVQTTW